ncbi:hypothetical protein B0A55_03310 [Friedmanniomyces simplex]|uniref:Uncharacterized protein n=1 Tax=Friedmanniomyces simplex TaxID=329884 RepID=A0A4U0XT78_9PEZI|nr:hypothetical protein B0A55_03310 [Friedmanniomyces simplex]
MDVRAELFKILGHRGLPHDKYECVVRLFNSQEAKIHALRSTPTGSAQDIRAMEQRLHDRGAEIKRLTDHVHELKVTLSERDEDLSLRNHQIKGYRKPIDELTTELESEHARRKAGADTLRRRFHDRREVAELRDDVSSGRLFEQEKRIQDLQRQIATLEETQEEQDTALLLATAFQKEAHEQRQQLGSQLLERDGRIRAMHEQLVALQESVYQLTRATSWDEATAFALQAQAATHLNLVKGLQAKLAKRNARIEKLIEAKLSFMRNMEERQETLMSNHKKMVKERKDAEARAMDAKTALQNANIRMAEWKKMAEEQQDLIGRLVAAGQAG